MEIEHRLRWSWLTKRPREVNFMLISNRLTTKNGFSVDDIWDFCTSKIYSTGYVYPCCSESMGKRHSGLSRFLKGTGQTSWPAYVCHRVPSFSWKWTARCFISPHIRFQPHSVSILENDYNKRCLWWSDCLSIYTSESTNEMWWHMHINNCCLPCRSVRNQAKRSEFPIDDAMD